VAGVDRGVVVNQVTLLLTSRREPVLAPTSCRHKTRVIYLIIKWRNKGPLLFTLIDEEIGEIQGGLYGARRVRHRRQIGAPFVDVLLRMELDAPNGVVDGFDGGHKLETVVVRRGGQRSVEFVQVRHRHVLARQAPAMEIRRRFLLAQRFQHAVRGSLVQLTGKGI